MVIFPAEPVGIKGSPNIFLTASFATLTDELIKLGWKLLAFPLTSIKFSALIFILPAFPVAKATELTTPPFFNRNCDVFMVKLPAFPALKAVAAMVLGAERSGFIPVISIESALTITLFPSPVPKLDDATVPPSVIRSCSVDI